MQGEGVADNINNLLPDSYWELLAGESGAEALKKAVLQESKKDTLGKFSVGDVGKASEAMSSFAIGMATVAKFLPSVSGTGLNALRLTAAGTLADSAVFTGIDSAVKHITDAFPSTLNPITQYLGDRSENSPWENKAKQAIEATALNAVAEGVIFGAIKSVKALKNLKSENVVLEEIADDVIKYLCAADAGILLRKKDVVNWVARPTKILEYRAAGLKIIHNDTVAMLTNQQITPEP